MPQDGSGALLHARHAFMPNKLGYCGPDDRGIIQSRLQDSSVDEKFVSILKNFEAAYPFVRLIGKSNRKDPLDRQVTEAYWIGNELLNNVATEDYYNFTLKDLRKKNSSEIRSLFLNLRDHALPHHTFYVLSTALNIISDFHHTTVNKGKISETLDSCMISWGKVLDVEKENLLISSRPLSFREGKLSLEGNVTRKVAFDPTVPPFDRVANGDYISVHWNYACDILSKTQLRNIRRYTKNDIDSANVFLRAINRAE
jgi:hypothetical protein